jgi:hypothetical protein
VNSLGQLLWQLAMAAILLLGMIPRLQTQQAKYAGNFMMLRAQRLAGS